MPRTYSEQTIQEFKNKLIALIDQEEKGIEIEKKINSQTEPIVRTISVEIYKNVLQMLDTHFAFDSKKRTYKYASGKRPGRPRKKNIEQAQEEIAATSEV